MLEITTLGRIDVRDTSGIGRAPSLLRQTKPLAVFLYLATAMERALALDPELGDAVAMRGMYRLLADRDWSGARSDFHAAVERSPNSLDARLALALFLAAMGEFEPALVHVRAAASLDPLGPVTRFTRAWCPYRARQYRASILELDTILELHPHFALAHPYAALNHALLGEPGPAQEAARRGIECLPDDHEVLALGAAAFGRAGSAREGQQAIGQLIALGSDRYLDPWALGVAYTGIGEFDTAAHWFRRMYEERSPSAFCIGQDPFLDPLREHEEFRHVVRRLAFPMNTDPS